MIYPKFDDAYSEMSGPNGYWGMGLAVVLSVFFIVASFSTEFVLGTASYWQTQTDDVTQYVSGFNAFFTAPWQWPLLAFNGFNYPSGTLVTFVDAIPLYALFLKVVVPQNLAPFNPFGVWVALCFVLQGIAAWWLTKVLQIRSWIFLITLVGLLLSFPALMARMGHISLMSHWIVLFALALYIQGRSTQNVPVFAWTMLLVGGFYVNIYLFVMASGIYGAAWLSSGHRFKPRHMLRMLWPCLVLSMSLFMTMLPLPLGKVTPEWGFGYYSMNLLSPFLGGSLIGVSYSEGPGQYEGMNYLGLGVLLSLLVIVLTCPARLLSALYRHKALLLLLVCFTVYAWSSQIYLGPREVATVHYPAFMQPITSQFRASGRFFWPVGYAILVFSLAFLYASVQRKYIGVLLISMLALQAVDLSGFHQKLLSIQGRSSAELLNASLWETELRPAVKHIYFYPKFKCGKEPHSTLLPVMKYVAERRITLNTGYIARYTPNCDDAAMEIAASSRPDTAYVFAAVEFPEPDTFMSLFPAGQKPDCKRIDFAHVCQYRTPEDKP